MVSVIGTFVNLGNNKAKPVYLWMAFQGLWLILRTVVFYFVESAAGTRISLAIGKPWETASVELEQRTLALVLALSCQQASLHPRRANLYSHDLMEYKKIRDRSEEVAWS